MGQFEKRAKELDISSAGLLIVALTDFLDKESYGQCKTKSQVPRLLNTPAMIALVYRWMNRVQTTKKGNKYYWILVYEKTAIYEGILQLGI